MSETGDEFLLLLFLKQQNNRKTFGLWRNSLKIHPTATTTCLAELLPALLSRETPVVKILLMYIYSWLCVWGEKTSAVTEGTDTFALRSQ